MQWRNDWKRRCTYIYIYIYIYICSSLNGWTFCSGVDFPTWTCWFWVTVKGSLDTRSTATSFLRIYKKGWRNRDVLPTFCNWVTLTTWHQEFRIWHSSKMCVQDLAFPRICSSHFILLVDWWIIKHVPLNFATLENQGDLNRRTFATLLGNNVAMFIPKGSMGLVYLPTFGQFLPTFTIKIDQM